LIEQHAPRFGIQAFGQRFALWLGQWAQIKTAG
jgi:hypothetical protein